MSLPQARIENEERSRNIKTQIRLALLEVWDPIGISEEPNAQDEYDSYIEPLYELLLSNASGSKIRDFLFWVAHDHMGFDAAQVGDMASTVVALQRISM